jgi:outer membrane lipoprotein-sorting protein
MATPIAAFARAASDAIRATSAFEAQESIRAGKIEVVARVRVAPPERIAVDYSTYVSPLAEMDDLLGGHLELAPDDLVGASLAYDGRTSWYVNPKTATALSVPGRHLYEPIPACDALGEVRFLDDLPRDFLLRDGGETVHNGRAARVVGLKPKRQRVSSLLRVATFLAERAEVTFDAETYFPLRITFLPGHGTPAASVLGPDVAIVIEYTDVRAFEVAESAFPPPPPAGMRLFSETLLAPTDLALSVPFPLPIAAIEEQGFRLVDDRAVAVLDASRERGYVTLVCARADHEGDAESLFVLRIGNYVSRLMARRRTMAGERGEAVEVAGQPARYHDHRTAWKDHPAAAELPLPADLVWERGGLFWVATAEGLTKEALVALASALA